MVTQLTGRQEKADLTDAYGSIPHRLVEVVLEKHHVPQKVKDLILDYYSEFSFRVSS